MSKVLFGEAVFKFNGQELKGFGEVNMSIPETIPEDKKESHQCPMASEGCDGEVTADEHEREWTCSKCDFHGAGKNYQ